MLAPAAWSGLHHSDPTALDACRRKRACLPTRPGCGRRVGGETALMMPDGGAIAIAGFLYQLVGSAAAAAAGRSVRLLRLETGGEDAMIVDGGEQSLLQFKYSAGPEPIAPGELAKILGTLQENSERFPRAAWRLVTNRPFSDAVRAVLAGRPAPANVSQENVDTIARLGGRLDVQLETFSSYRGQLRSFGRAYGLRDEESETGCQRLVGWFMQRVGETHGAGTAVTHDAFCDAFLGFPGPRTLCRGERADDFVRELDDAAVAVGGPVLVDVLPRRALASLWAGPEPIVVTGQGGVGKTSAVMRALRDHMVSTREPGLILLSQSVDDVRDAIARWRNTPRDAGREPLVPSLSRLALANRGVPGSTIVVVLDGIEEHGWSTAPKREHAAALIALAREPLSSGTAGGGAPRVKLVVTCRDAGDLADFAGSPGIDGPVPVTRERTIDLAPFEDDDEFAMAWVAWCPHLLPVPFVAPARGLGTMDDPPGRASPALGLATERGELLNDLLRLPAFLRCFRELGRTSGGESMQRALLAGEDGPLATLIERFVIWFVAKANVRSASKPAWTREALRAVAAATRGRGPTFHLRDDWIGPTIEGVGLDAKSSRQLFDDAVSSGIIDRGDGVRRAGGQAGRPDGPRWRWRHSVVRDHLDGRLGRPSGVGAVAAAVAEELP